MADRVRRIHAGHLAFGVLLALGFNAFVYPILFEWLLPYRGLRVPARATMLVLLSLAVLAGLGLAPIRTRLGMAARTAVAIAAIVMTSVEYFSRPSLREVDPQASPWYSTLAQMDDAVVFEWPVSHPSRLTEMIDVLYMHRSTSHWRPFFNGYSGKYPNSYMDCWTRCARSPTEIQSAIFNGRAQRSSSFMKCREAAPLTSTPSSAWHETPPSR